MSCSNARTERYKYIVAREVKTPAWLEEFKKEYDDFEPMGKFVFWWLSSFVVAVILAIIILSIVWTPWVGIVTGIIVVILITIGCFFYLDDCL